MTLRHINIFIAVADEGGMSAAAKKLHISQPSISQAISELEKYYDVKLFERLSQKLYITREGELMLSYSRHIMDSFKQMEESIKLTAEKSLLRIGCSVTVGTCLINDILNQAKEKMPTLSFQVMVSNSTDIERAILCNEVDLGIVEGIIKSKDLLMTPICQDELVLVCGSCHPLAKEKTVTFDQLDGQDFVCRESGSSERNQLEKLLEEKGVHFVRTFCSTNTEAIKNAVIYGRGIAVLSKRMVEKEVENGKIIILPIEGTEVTRNINLVIHKNKYISKGLKIVQDITQNSFGLIHKGRV